MQTETSEIAEAKQWFEQRMYSQNYLLNGNGMQLYTDWRPDWNKATMHELSGSYTVEIPIVFTKQFSFVSSQLQAEYEKTKDPKYLASETRLIIETNLNTGKKQDFIMLVSPSLKYVESSSKRQNSYLNMDSNFDGMVLYYTPNWDFANGWSFSGGKIDGILESKVETRAPDNFIEYCLARAGIKDKESFKDSSFWQQAEFNGCYRWFSSDTSNGSGSSSGSGSGEGNGMIQVGQENPKKNTSIEQPKYKPPYPYPNTENPDQEDHDTSQC